MNGIDQNRLLHMRSSIIDQNAALRRAAGGDAPVSDVTPGASGFGNVLSDALSKVNAQQQKSQELSAAYERGETSNIVDVMIERQKASLGFEATLQVRNKLLSAYRDIMNMPV
jgi:flagellar hook-basal body complex protein FliE